MRGKRENWGPLVRVPYGPDGTKRRVALSLGESRAPGKVRLAVWSHASRQFCAARAYPAAAVLGPAPEKWPQTRAAQQALAGHFYLKGGRPWNGRSLPTPSWKAVKASR